MTLACASGDNFTSVKFAAYGNPSGSCGSYSVGSCNADNVTAWVESMCVGKSTCTLPADPTVRDTRSPLDQVLGDPCYGVEKHLFVQLDGCPNTPPKPQPLPLKLSGKGDGVIFDWGHETGGFTTLSFGATSDDQQTVSLAYSESSLYWLGFVAQFFAFSFSRNKFSCRAIVVTVGTLKPACLKN